MGCDDWLIHAATNPFGFRHFTRYGSDNQIDLDFRTNPGIECTLQYSADMSTWTTIDTVTFSNTNANATCTDSLPARVNGRRAFYRVMWTP